MLKALKMILQQHLVPNIDWSDAIKKEAMVINNENLGEVYALQEGYVRSKEH